MNEIDEAMLKSIRGRLAAGAVLNPVEQRQLLRLVTALQDECRRLQVRLEALTDAVKSEDS